MSHMAVEPTGCRCGKPTRDHAYVCEDCLTQLSQALAEIPWLLDELENTRTRTRGIDYRALGGAKSSEPPLPIHPKAAEHVAELHNILVAWVKFCAEDGITHQSTTVALPRDNSMSMSRWLMWRVDGLGFVELGSDCVNEIVGNVRAGKRIIDRPAESWFAGPCDQCEEDLYAKAQTGAVQCRNCEKTYDIAERREWLLAEAEDRLANATEIARAVSWLGSLPLTPDRVWKWAERGRIVAHGHDGRSPLYRIGDAINLLAAGTRAG